MNVKYRMSVNNIKIFHMLIYSQIITSLSYIMDNTLWDHIFYDKRERQNINVPVGL